MSFHKIRATAKAFLSRTPLFPPAKKVHDRVKIFFDRRQFSGACPEGMYIHYTEMELLQQRAEGFCSQLGQDFFLWHQFLKDRPAGRFVDIGANKPVSNNNSFFLEQRGWRGVAIDPMQGLANHWKERRHTKLLSAAVSDKRTTVDFVEFVRKDGWEHQMSGFKEHVRNEDLTIHDYTEYQVRACPLGDLLEDTNVDLILIDVEGAELKVLSGIDFTQLKPEFVLVENVGEPGGSPSVRNYMAANDYACIARFAASDDLYHRTGGSP